MQMLWHWSMLHVSRHGVHDDKVSLRGSKNATIHALAVIVAVTVTVTQSVTVTATVTAVTVTAVTVTVSC